MSSQNTSRFYLLDAVRGVAALAVVFFHVGWLPYGYLAVDLFFAMSGFVLMHAYRDGLRFGSFMLDRAIRLGPLAFMGGLLGYVMNGGSPWIMALVPTGDVILYPANTVLWSLLFEVILSVCFGLLYRFGAKAWWLVALPAGCLYFWSIWHLGSLGIGHSRPEFLAGLGRSGFWFCVGMAAYHLKGAVPSFPWPKGAVILGELSYPLYVSHLPIVMREWPAAASIPVALVVAAALAFAYDRPARELLRMLRRREGDGRHRIGRAIVETRPLDDAERPDMAI